MQTKTIYVPLLNEGTDVWRPVTAEPIVRAIYRIVSEPTDPDNEEWVYRTGQEVAVEERVFVEGERGLVAVEQLHTLDWTSRLKRSVLSRMH